jgi:thioredoxin-dependent peroxiredoxin
MELFPRESLQHSRKYSTVSAYGIVFKDRVFPRMRAKHEKEIAVLPPFFVRKSSIFRSKILAEVIFVSDAVKEQQSAPDFTLPAVGSDAVVKNGQVHLQELQGRPVVLYFYPKDDTPGCTKEACSFRDANREMQKRGAIVLGVSTDSVASHQKFAEKYGLSYPLLSDTDATVAQLYGVYGEKNMYGKKYLGVNRETFLIDKDGVVRKVWHKVKPDDHASEVLSTIEELHL